MALARAVPHRQLEGEVLLAAKQIQIAYRRLVVRTPHDRIHHNAHARGKGDRICRRPTRRCHGSRQLFLHSEQRDIHRITRMAVRGFGQTRPGQERVLPAFDLMPDQRREQIGQPGPDEQSEQDPVPVAAQCGSGTHGGNINARNARSYYFLPNEIEWRKAAYDNSANSDSYLYPTASDAAPFDRQEPAGNLGNGGLVLLDKPRTAEFILRT